MRRARRAGRVMTAAYALAATNKCLAQSNKSRIRRKATKQMSNPEQSTGTSTGPVQSDDYGTSMNPFRRWRDEPVSSASQSASPAAHKGDLS